MEKIEILDGRNNPVRVYCDENAVMVADDSGVRELMRADQDAECALLPVLHKDAQSAVFVGVRVTHNTQYKTRDYFAVVSAYTVVARTQLFAAGFYGIHDLGDGIWAIPSTYRDAPNVFVRGFGAREWHLNLDEQYPVKAFATDGYLYMPLERGGVYVVSARGELVHRIPSTYPQNLFLGLKDIVGECYIEDGMVIVKTISRTYQFDSRSASLVQMT